MGGRVTDQASVNVHRSGFPESRSPALGSQIGAVAASFVFCAFAFAKTSGIFYYVGRDELALKSLKAHGDKISSLRLMGYSLDATGQLQGNVDERALDEAKRRQIPVVAAVVNARFDPSIARAILEAGPARWRQIADKLISVAVARGFAGWEMDFEHIPSRYRDALTRFSSHLGGALKNAKLVYGVDLTPQLPTTDVSTPFHRWMKQEWQDVHDAKAIAADADYIMWMAYALHGQYTPPGPCAPIVWVEETLKKLLNDGVPSGKVFLGIPTYSRHWHAQTKPGGAAVALDFETAVKSLAALGAKLLWDEAGQFSYAVGQRNHVREYLYLEDARGFAARSALISKYRLKGFALYRLGWEDPAVWRDVERTNF